MSASGCTKVDLEGLTCMGRTPKGREAVMKKCSRCQRDGSDCNSVGQEHSMWQSEQHLFKPLRWHSLLLIYGSA